MGLDRDAWVVPEHQDVETGHGRQEARTDATRPAPAPLGPAREWRDRCAVGMVISERGYRPGHREIEADFNILSVPRPEPGLAEAVRGHGVIDIPQSDDPRSDNLCLAGRAGYHRR